MPPFRFQDVFKRLIEVGWGAKKFLFITITVQNDEMYSLSGINPYVEIEGIHPPGTQPFRYEFKFPDSPDDPGLDKEPPEPTVPWPPTVELPITDVMMATYYAWAFDGVLNDVGAGPDTQKLVATIFINVHKIKADYLDEEGDPATSITIKFNDTAPLGSYFRAQLLAAYVTGLDVAMNDEGYVTYGPNADVIDADSTDPFGSGEPVGDDEFGNPDPSHTVVLNFEDQTVTITKD